MQIDTLEIKGCKRILSVEIPWKEIDEKTTQIAKDIKKIININGFRPGKIPINYLKRLYAKEIKEEVLKDLIPKAIENYIKQETLELASEPDVYNIVYAEQCPLTFNIALEIMPNITPINYKDVEIKKPKIEVSDEEIEESINELKKKDSILEPVIDREAMDGDYIGIKILSPNKFRNEEIDKDYVYNFILGNENIYNVINNSIRGMKINETKEIEIEINGGENKITLLVQLVEIKEIKYPSIEDIYKDKEKVNNIDDFKETIRKEIIDKKIKDEAKTLKDLIIDNILESNEIEVPDSYIRAQLNAYLYNWLSKLESDRIKVPYFMMNLNNFIEKTKDEAVKKVKKDFILDAIAKLENIDIDDDYVNRKIEEYAKQIGQNPIALKGKLQARNEYKILESQWRRELVLDFLLQYAKIT